MFGLTDVLQRITVVNWMFDFVAYCFETLY